jgi:hypothetical protein
MGVQKAIKTRKSYGADFKQEVKRKSSRGFLYTTLKALSFPVSIRLSIKMLTELLTNAYNFFRSLLKVDIDNQLVKCPKTEIAEEMPPLGEELLMIDVNGKHKMFRQAALERRCLIISDRYYEWRHIHRISKRTGQRVKNPDKYPYQIMVKDRPYFYIAGVYNNWTDQDTGENVDTLAMVTTAANELTAKVHNSKERPLQEAPFWETCLVVLSAPANRQCRAVPGPAI